MAGSPLLHHPNSEGGRGGWHMGLLYGTLSFNFDNLKIDQKIYHILWNVTCIDFPTLASNNSKGFKIILLTFKSLNGLVALYLSELLLPYELLLRSADAGLLVIPSTKRSAGKREFVSFCGIAYPDI